MNTKLVYAFALLTLASSASAQESFKVSDHFSPTANPAVHQLAHKLLHEKKLLGQMDRVTGKISVFPPYHDDNKGDRIELSVTMRQGAKPVLFVSAIHASSAWIFMHSADFRIGEAVTTLEDPKPYTKVEDYGVFECMAWPADTKEVQTVVKALASGKCKLCGLRGKDGDRLATLSVEDFNNILTVYFALGGEPLNL